MFDDLYTKERSASLGQMVQRPAEAPPEEGFWEGLPKAAGLGVMHGGARVAQAVGLAGAVVPMAIDKVLGDDNMSGESLTDKYFDAYTSTVNPALDYWKLPADGIGKAGEIVHGLAGIVLPLAAAGGNPELLMLSQGMGTAADLSKQGVDGQTAASGAMVSAFTTGIGMKLPMTGNTLAQSVAIGVGGNVGVGVLDRAAMNGILEHQDYNAVAAQYKPFDPTQMALDAFIGSAFGTLAHAIKKPETHTLTPDEQAAALAMNEVRTRDGDTLTRPGDVAAADAAHEAQNLAREQLDAGKPVSVAHGLSLDEARVAEAAARVGDEISPALREELAVNSKDLPRSPDLSTEHRAIETDAYRLILNPENNGRKPAGGNRAVQEGQPGQDLGRPGERARSGDEGQSGLSSKSSRPGSPAGEITPEISSAQQILAERPDLTIRLDDGTDVRASDALREADAVVNQAGTEANAFMAAVTCATRFES